MSALNSINQNSESQVQCHVRIACDEDEAAIRAFLRVQRHTIQHLIHSDIDLDLSGIEAFYNNRDGFIFVVEINSRIVGTIALFALEEFRCEIRKFYLAPQMNSVGFGAKLLSTVIRIAKARDFHFIQVETLSCLVTAYALYARFGFSPSKQKFDAHAKGSHVLERALVSNEVNEEQAG